MAGVSLCILILDKQTFGSQSQLWLDYLALESLGLMRPTLL